MSDNIIAAIDAISDDRPNDFKNAISNELISRLNDRIDLQRMEVAGKLFGVTPEETSDEDQDV